MKTINKKICRKFDKDVAALMKKLGFRPIEDGSRTMVAWSSVGLYIVYQPNEEADCPGNHLLSINSRFHDAEAAVYLLGSSFTTGMVNPYSGKLNLIHTEPTPLIDRFASLCRDIEVCGLTDREYKLLKAVVKRQIY